MKILFTILALLAAFGFTLCQDKNNRGYFIDLNGKRVDCFIVGRERLNTPSELVYKLDESGPDQRLSTTDVREFGTGESRYLSALVMIDHSSDDPAKLSSNRNPIWEKEQLFLKVVFNGEASLFYYAKGSQKRFFFSTQLNDSIRQLIFKRYQLNSLSTSSYDPALNASSVISNNTFKDQLMKEVNCEGLAQIAHKTVYSMSSLLNYFRRYNECKGAAVVASETNRTPRERKFHLTATPGIDLAEFKPRSVSGVSNRNVPDEKRVRIGVEIEYVLPLFKKQWTVFVEPTFQSFQTKDRLSARYRSLEIPFGTRLYVPIGGRARMFLNAAAVLDFPNELHARLRDIGPPDQIPRTVELNFTAGGGLKYGRLGIEARYYTPRKRSDDSGDWELVSEKVSLIFGVRIY